MAQERQHMYRMADGLLGGVCSGIAQRFDMDAALIRILTVLLTVATAGFFALVYVAIWLILPAQPSQGGTVDVDPDSVRSEIYEQVVNRANVGTNPARVGYAPISPAPPAAASSYYAAQPTSSYFVTGAQAAVVGAQGAASNKHVSRSSLAAGLIVGVLLIALGIAALYSNVFSTAALAQYWPLVLVAAGVVRITIPAKDGSRTLTTWLGVLVVFVGLVALASSLGVFQINPEVWVMRAGPFLLIAVGLFIMGRASKSDILIASAGIVLVLFLVVGAVSSLQDATPEIGVSLSFSPEALSVQGGN